MATHRTTRKPAPARVEVPAGYPTRLHATTALSRIMRGETASARELLAELPPADLAEIRAASAVLASLAGGTAEELAS